MTPHARPEAALAEMPIMDGVRIHSISMAVLVPHEAQARTNHDQSLQRIAERGGLSLCEAVAILEDRPWCRMNDREAEAALIQMCREWKAAALPPPGALAELLKAVDALRCDDAFSSHWKMGYDHAITDAGQLIRAALAASPAVERREEAAPTQTQGAALASLADEIEQWVDGMLPSRSATAMRLPVWAQRIRAFSQPQASAPIETKQGRKAR